MMQNTALKALVLMMVVVGGVGSVAGQEVETANNTSASNVSTGTPIATATPVNPATETEVATESCEAVPDQARLHAPDTEISPGSPGEISGGFQLAPDAECTLVVQVTLSVPSGMYITGTSDAFSAGAGMATTTFEVAPGTGIRDIRATVYSADTGSRMVTADIAYWPQGHPEQAEEMDGFAFTFEVTEPVTPTPESTEADDTASGSLTDIQIGGGVLVLLALVGLVAVALRS